MRFIVFFSWMFVSTTVFGSQNNYPIPQEINYKTGTITSTQFRISSNVQLDQNNLKMLSTVFPLQKGKRGLAIPIVISKLVPQSDIKQVSGAYTIDVLQNQIKIEIYDQASLFYAIKTLKNFIIKGKGISIPLMQIKDYPDVLHRGTVEGFYGTPWSFEDRVQQLKFYGDIKLNTYIYGPKDDPYHSSPHWRDPYPTEKANELKELVNEAKRNYVDFVWAIHPGKDIVWNKKDSLNLLYKFEKMYALGVRSFAVFFDDISGEGTKPEKQAGILNYLHESFVIKHADVNPLIMCPTEYNKSWANPKAGTYLDILGDQLNPAIQIMWTGNRVISNIDESTMNWINARIKRKAFIWWNFPVSDYVRDHLLMGPVYGNTPDIAPMISGFVSNPMEHAEASKIAIYGVAAYTWNMKSFDSAKAFDAAIKYIMPQSSWALKIFAENNSDLGINGHAYRRTESVRIAPVTKELEAAWTTGKNDDKAYAIVKSYFDSVSLAPSVIIKNLDNKNLIKEISPWLRQFELLGKAGSMILKTNNEFSKKSTADNWNAFLNINSTLRKIKHINDTENQNPGQPGVKTGSLVLTPFVKNSFSLIGNKIMGNAIDNNKSKNSNENFFTNIPQLLKQPIQIAETSVAISPLLEVVNIQPNEYFGLSWLDNRTATLLRINFDTKGFEKWGRIETSADGKIWNDIKTKDTTYTRQQKIPANAKFVRYTNISDSTHQMYVKEFAIRTISNDNSKDKSLAFDKNLETAVSIQPKDVFTASFVDSVDSIKIFLETYGQPVEISCTNGNILYKGNQNYISIPASKLKSCTQIKLSNKGIQSIRIVEFIGLNEHQN